MHKSLFGKKEKKEIADTLQTLKTCYKDERYMDAMLTTIPEVYEIPPE